MQSAYMIVWIVIMPTWSLQSSITLVMRLLRQLNIVVQHWRYATVAGNFVQHFLVGLTWPFSKTFNCCRFMLCGILVLSCTSLGAYHRINKHDSLMKRWGTHGWLVGWLAQHLSRGLCSMRCAATLLSPVVQSRLVLCSVLVRLCPSSSHCSSLWVGSLRGTLFHSFNVCRKLTAIHSLYCKGEINVESEKTRRFLWILMKTRDSKTSRSNWEGEDQQPRDGKTILSLWVDFLARSRNENKRYAAAPSTMTSLLELGVVKYHRQYHNMGSNTNSILCTVYCSTLV